MKIIKRCVCDSCGQIIQNAEDGVIVQGNIYVADPEERGGLVGNNFKDNGEVNEVAYHLKCLYLILDYSAKRPEYGTCTRLSS